MEPPKKPARVVLRRVLVKPSTLREASDPAKVCLDAIPIGGTFYLKGMDGTVLRGKKTERNRICLDGWKTSKFVPDSFEVYVNV